MFRDEEDVAEPVCMHLLAEGVDRLIVADNLSTDRTRQILDGIDSVTVVDDPEPGYYQSRKVSALAAAAYEMGAEWVLPFDADEVWYAPGGERTIAAALAALPADVDVVKAPGWDHLVRDEGDGPFSPWCREQAQPMVKVAFRAHPNPLVDMGNHGVVLPGAQGRDVHGVLAFRHFQYRSLPHLIRKLRTGRAAYEATDLHPDQGLHWRSGGLKTDEELARDWALLCSEEGLVFDPAPLRVPVGR